MLTDLQRAAAQAVVEIFETGKLSNNYGMVTLIAGDTGGLTYGKHQTTLNSGNLYLLIKAYCEDSGADLKNELSAYLGQLQDRDQSLNNDQAFKELLRKAGADNDMKEVQDAFFERVYWQPAFATAKAMEFKRQLSFAVVYDSFIHGSWKRIRDRVNAKHGATYFYNETGWIRAYNDERRNWLANHSNPVLRNTVYRQDAIKLLMNSDNWDLRLPVVVRGVTISAKVLGFDSAPVAGAIESAAPPRATAVEDSPRMLILTDPNMSGEDVREVQVALEKFGYPLNPDGIYGPITAEAVRVFQRSKGLRSDGIVGNVTRFNLGIA